MEIQYRIPVETEKLFDALLDEGVKNFTNAKARDTLQALAVLDQAIKSTRKEIKRKAPINTRGMANDSNSKD